MTLPRCILAAMTLGCGPDSGTGTDVAKVEHVFIEDELHGVRLTAAAVEHLGIETTTVVATTAPRTRTVAGFLTAPPGRALAVTAPVAGTLRAGDQPLRAGAAVARGDVLLRLTPLAPVGRDIRAQAQLGRSAARARVELAEARVDRLTRLLSKRASSERAIEEATAELETARAEDKAASARLRVIKRAPLAADVALDVPAPEDGLVRTVAAAPGQTVAPGAPLFDVIPAAELWVRVPVVPGELDRLDVAASVTVGRLGGEQGERFTAKPVKAPPSADPVAATVDLFYALDSDAPLRRPGERVMATLSYLATEPRVEVPRAAVVLDVDGSAWVYACDDAPVFRRIRVELAVGAGEQAQLRRGPPEGTCVVAVGAIELLGAEFGVNH